MRASFSTEMESSGILRFIGPAKLFDISAANQNQGGKCICSPRISRLARHKVRFLQRAVCHSAARIDNNYNLKSLARFLLHGSHGPGKLLENDFFLENSLNL